MFAVHGSGVGPLCAIVSALLQYFMLVMFMVMAAEAINLYLKLVVVLGHSISNYVIKATIICWGELYEPTLVNTVTILTDAIIT